MTAVTCQHVYSSMIVMTSRYQQVITSSVPILTLQSGTEFKFDSFMTSHHEHASDGQSSYVCARAFSSSGDKPEIATAVT
jgi:hypothetical protein